MSLTTTPPAQNLRLSPDGDALLLLDQTLLPRQELVRRLTTPEEFYQAIADLQVRGAPAIGLFAAYALALLARRHVSLPTADFLAACQREAARLNSARPTAVNLSLQLDRQLAYLRENAALSPAALCAGLLENAVAFQQEDIAMCRAIAEHGLALLSDGDGLLTHCNAGPLATSCYGTALGPMLLGRERGLRFHVYCDETRPLLQGARLTTYELQKADVPCTLICDNMASLVLSQGRVQACLVGCDRVARNGDTANKIGTSGLAILAHYYKVPFYVLGPSTTLDFSCPTGGEIPIEERDAQEIRSFYGQEAVAPAAVPCYNPAFDVTPHHLISAIITERGVCRAPYAESFARLYPERWQKEVQA